MDIEYEYIDHKGNTKIGRCTFEEAAEDHILSKEDPRNIFSKKVILENQPAEVCKALGRLLEVMYGKGLLSLDDFHYIIRSKGLFSTTAKIKKECSEE